MLAVSPLLGGGVSGPFMPMTSLGAGPAPCAGWRAAVGPPAGLRRGVWQGLLQGPQGQLVFGEVPIPVVLGFTCHHLSCNHNCLVPGQAKLLY